MSGASGGYVPFPLTPGSGPSRYETIYRMTRPFAPAKPRYRVRADGWIRHDGGGMPAILRDHDRVEIVVVAGNASFIQGFPAGAYRGWKHAGFSGDIVAWRPHGR